jgi:hypothetical protein
MKNSASELIIEKQGNNAKKNEANGTEKETNKKNASQYAQTDSRFGFYAKN